MSRAEGLSRITVSFLAAACGLAVANLYYVQPLLLEIGRSLHLSDVTVGLIPALSQIGVAGGVLFLLPLGDVVAARSLLTVAVLAQAAALAAMAAATSGPLVIMMSLVIGFFGITAYVLPPYATLKTPRSQRGHVTALLTQGVMVGILLARTVSGVVGLHFGWRTMYAVAAVLMVLLAAFLRRVVGYEAKETRKPYLHLMLSLVQVVREEPALRRSALGQALNFGSFNVLWIGMTFHMQSPAFGWRSDRVGALAVLGAASAALAPLVGKAADRRGPRWSLRVSLAIVVLAWGMLAAFGSSLVAIVVGLILLDTGSVAADISNRTIIFGLRPEIRTRLTALYIVTMFVGGGIMTWLTGVAWAYGGWLAVCALGAAAAGLALGIALQGKGAAVESEVSQVI